MNHEDLAAYLTAAAWADGPVTDAETALVENLLFSLRLEREEAKELVKRWEFKAPSAPDLASLKERPQALALLRALLVLSYSDGHFGIDELPYLTKVLDKFKVSSAELVQLRLQAQYYLDPEAHDLEVDPALVEVGNWEGVEAAARQSKVAERISAEKKIRADLQGATPESLLVMLYRGRSFDVAEAKAEFDKRRADLAERHGALDDVGLLRAQITLFTLAKWDRLYAERCSSCGLAAPGLKSTPCLRCNEDYL